MKKCEELLIEDAINTAVECEKKWIRCRFLCTAAVITSILEGVALIIILM